MRAHVYRIYSACACQVGKATEHRGHYTPWDRHTNADLGFPWHVIHLASPAGERNFTSRREALISPSGSMWSVSLFAAYSSDISLQSKSAICLHAVQHILAPRGVLTSQDCAERPMYRT